MGPSTRQGQLLPWSVPHRGKVGRLGCSRWGGIYSHKVGIKQPGLRFLSRPSGSGPGQEIGSGTSPCIRGSWHKPEEPQGMQSASPAIVPSPAHLHLYFSCCPAPLVDTEVDQHSAVLQPIRPLPRQEPLAPPATHLTHRRQPDYSSWSGESP